MKQIDKLIINSPYEEPKYYWQYDREHRSVEKREGRRSAGWFFFCQLEAIETLIWLAEMERREDAGCKMHDTGYQNNRK